MATFETMIDYSIFADRVRSSYRYLHDRITQDFLKRVQATRRSRERTIRKESILWRARLGCQLQDVKSQHAITVMKKPLALESEKMIPDPTKVRQGRANPVGIPCLYLADDPNTAMAEVRPWIGQEISLAKFEIIRDLEVIDFSKDRGAKTTISASEDYQRPSPKDLERAVWSAINDAFSEPVTMHDTSPSYVPTQILTELFKTMAYDGIVYKSSYGLGLNYALFDLSVAKLVETDLYKLEDINFKFKPASGLKLSVSWECFLKSLEL